MPKHLKLSVTGHTTDAVTGLLAAITHGKRIHAMEHLVAGEHLHEFQRFGRAAHALSKVYVCELGGIYSIDLMEWMFWSNQYVEAGERFQMCTDGLCDVSHNRSIAPQTPS